MGGNMQLLFVPVEDVFIIPEAEANGIIEDDIELNPDKEYFSIAFTEGTAQNKEPLKEVDAGNFFEQLISFYIAKQRPEVTAALMEMLERKFIVLLKNNNGERKLIGTIAEPLRFEFKPTIDPNHNGKNGYECNFFGDTVGKSKFYEGNILGGTWYRITTDGARRITADSDERVVA